MEKLHKNDAKNMALRVGIARWCRRIGLTIVPSPHQGEQSERFYKTQAGEIVVKLLADVDERWKDGCPAALKADMTRIEAAVEQQRK